VEVCLQLQAAQDLEKLPQLASLSASDAAQLFKKKPNTKLLEGKRTRLEGQLVFTWASVACQKAEAAVEQASRLAGLAGLSGEALPDSEIAVPGTTAGAVDDRAAMLGPRCASTRPAAGTTAVTAAGTGNSLRPAPADSQSVVDAQPAAVGRAVGVAAAAPAVQRSSMHLDLAELKHTLKAAIIAVELSAAGATPQVVSLARQRSEAAARPQGARARAKDYERAEAVHQATVRVVGGLASAHTSCTLAEQQRESHASEVKLLLSAAREVKAAALAAKEAAGNGGVPRTWELAEVQAHAWYQDALTKLVDDKLFE
jgi:acyl-CoA hydrolase